MTGDSHARPRRGRKLWRRSPSIRARVLAIVLIPGSALFITGASVAGYLTSQSLSARHFSSLFEQSMGPILTFESTVEQERTMSLRVLGGDRRALTGLQAQWGCDEHCPQKSWQSVGRSAQH